jgi:hypothetical protein
VVEQAGMVGQARATEESSPTLPSPRDQLAVLVVCAYRDLSGPSRGLGLSWGVSEGVIIS